MKKHVLLLAVLLMAIVLSACTAESVPTEPTEPPAPRHYALMDTFDTLIADTMADAKAGALSVKKHFKIASNAEAAPVPDPNNYGSTDDPASLQWLLDEAAELLDRQDTVFSTDLELYPGSQVTYYYDETILAITWKQVFYDFVYTMCEVKVADASQFRRHIEEGTYGSNILSQPTDMAAKVNAVAASAGDYYRGRNYGIVVYEGKVYQVSSGSFVDTCYVDYNGDLHFTRSGEILDVESAQAYVDEHNISFSLAFGPVLVDDGQQCEPAGYALGEVNDHYPRAAVCQKDELHYVLVTANWQGPYASSPTIHTFAQAVAELGVEKAYSLDGGQTGAIAMDGKLMNPTLRGEQRRISDIIYFGTAIPDHIPEEAEPGSE